MGDAAKPARLPVRRRRAGVDGGATTTASPRCCSTAASSTACGCSAPAPSTTWRRTTCPAAPTSRQFGRPLFAETTFDGVGFGLGFSVVQNPVDNKVLSSIGEFAWGGAASTAFWVDPAEEITALFLTQLLPSSTHPIRPQLKQLVYQALVD